MEPCDMDMKREGASADNHRLTCQELMELVTAYQKGMLTTEARVRFDAHLATCPPCVRYVEQTKLTTYVLGGLCDQVEHTPADQELLWVFRFWKTGLRS